MNIQTETVEKNVTKNWTGKVRWEKLKMQKAKENVTDLFAVWFPGVFRFYCSNIISFDCNTVLHNPVCIKILNTSNNMAV